MANREWLMRSMKYNESKYTITNFYMSEKMDGMRAIWIPWSVGKMAGFVPYCNTQKGDSKTVICSGLFSRYGKVIHAPQWVSDELMALYPNHCVDGELYAGRGDDGWAKVMSACKKQGSNVGSWDGITFNVFDAPNPQEIFQDGQIKNRTWTTKIEGVKCIPDKYRLLSEYFDLRLAALSAATKGTFAKMVEFERLPFGLEAARARLHDRMAEIVAAGGEGVMLRHPSAAWEPKQSYFILKHKAWSDAEGVVVGYTAGLGKYRGMIGSIRLRLESGVEFDLSGFTDAERIVIGHPLDVSWIEHNEGEYTTREVSIFKIGSELTFKYRELTPDGKPKEARYLRPRMD